MPETIKASLPGLPVELIHLITSELYFEERMEMRLVCRTLDIVLESELDRLFEQVCFKVSYAGLQRLVRLAQEPRLRYKIRRLRLERSRPGPEYYQAQIRPAKTYEQLDFIRGERTGMNLILLADALRQLPRLEALEIVSFSAPDNIPWLSVPSTFVYATDLLALALTAMHVSQASLPELLMVRPHIVDHERAESASIEALDVPLEFKDALQRLKTLRLDLTSARSKQEALRISRSDPFQTASSIDELTK
jgi:hypothetical protein